MNRKMLTMALVVVVGLLGTTSFSLGQSAKHIDWQRMARDLEIMEGVLDQLLDGSSPGWGFERGTARGVYFAGYGVVFQVNLRSLRFFTAVTATQRAAKVRKKQAEETQVVVVAPDAEGTVELQENWEKQIADIKEQVVTFLGDYADAIRQLSPSERITVVVDLGRRGFDRFWPFAVSTEGGGYRSGNRPETANTLEVTAMRKDIIDYRKGKLTEVQFRKRISFREKGEDKRTSRNVAVMAKILDTALGQEHHQAFSSDGESQGTYLKGLGALFFMHASLQGQYSVLPLFSQLNRTKSRSKAVVRAVETEEEREADLGELYKKFRDDVLEVVADYGHTLRTVAPSEYVAVSVDLSGPLPEQGVPRGFMVSAQKRELDKYSRGRLTLAQLRDKVSFQEF